MIYYNCLPEVRERCEAGKKMRCGGVFPARYGACRTRNKEALKERRARKEAGANGIQGADHKLAL